MEEGLGAEIKVGWVEEKEEGLGEEKGEGWVGEKEEGSEEGREGGWEGEAARDTCRQSPSPQHLTKQSH
eukprot:202717-Chlamydomonas_euryale.AAC.1